MEVVHVFHRADLSIEELHQRLNGIDVDGAGFLIDVTVTPIALLIGLVYDLQLNLLNLIAGNENGRDDLDA